MQFITYFELNENMPESERQAIAGKVMGSGLFPPEGVNILSWDATPDLWGTIRVEADTVEQVVQAIGLWRAAGGGLFKTVSNQQKWDTLGAERSGAGWRSGELPEGPVVASSPFGGLSLHLLPAL